ncbi:hypothetical protein ACFOSS_13190 [Pseudaeromonas sharmana]|uniref:Uncharacterized protein n=1 Tax=Pseudaeromonas sharmana TaxID=328412 RepID=A0ABV8CQP1_9GAMM
MMYDDRDIGLALPIGYVREHCTSWQRLCDELDLEADGLENGVYLSQDRIDIDLATAKRFGLCQEWWL